MMEKAFRISPRLLLGALLLFWLGFVVVQAPAVWVLKLLPMPVSAAGVSGIVWHGSVNELVVLQDQRRISLGQVEWRISPQSLLRFALCSEITTQLVTQKFVGTICVSAQQTVEIRDATLEVPASLLQLWLPVRLAGKIEQDIPLLRFRDYEVLALNGSGQWHDAGVFVGDKRVGLGAIRVDWSNDQGGNVLGRYTDLNADTGTDGPFQLDLLSALSLQGTFQTQGNIVLRSGASDALRQLLELVAENIDSERFRIEWSGDWK